MTDPTQPPPPPQHSVPPPQTGYPTAYPPAYQMGPIGKVRGTGLCILLAIVTLGIYTFVWWFQVHEEMKRHTGRGLGGLVAFILAFFVGIVTPFFTSDEVGKLYESGGRKAPVSAITGLWYFPGMFILVGPIIWFVKTNGALNDYWRGLGAA